MPYWVKIMALRVKKIAWFLSLIASLAIAFTRCEKTPPGPTVGDLSIAGQVLRSGHGVSGVEVKLTGEDSALVLTDSLGAYAFLNLESGLYRVQPQSGGFNFNPGALTLELNRQDLRSQNFQMTARGPRLVPLKSSLEFGQVFTGAGRTLLLGITNLGAATLTVSSVAFSNTAFRSPVKSFSLSPDSLIFMAVEFAPVTSGLLNAQLTLNSNDSTNPKVVINLSGSAVAPGQAKIEAQPLSLAFGPVRLGQSTTLKLTLRNAAPIPLKSSPSRRLIRLSGPQPAALLSPRDKVWSSWSLLLLPTLSVAALTWCSPATPPDNRFTTCP